MGKQKESYTPGLVGLPSVFIAVAWLALWLVWPLGIRPLAAAHRAAVTQVSYMRFGTGKASLYMQPDIFVHSPMVKSRLAEQDEGDTAALCGLRVRHPRFLERRTMRGETAPAGEMEPLATRASGQLVAYLPRWQDDHVFSRKAAQDMRVFAEPAGELKKYHFRIPAIPVESLKQREKPWLVVVYVEVGEAGRPEHVFLSTGCDDPKINAVVVRTMYRGRLAEPGIRCGGHVTVSFGSR